jgi:signal transduction histidine kinase
MADGGKLTIETANTYFDDRYAAENASVAPGQYVMICVTDTGTGMSADAITKAFEPFLQRSR